MRRHVTADRLKESIGAYIKTIDDSDNLKERDELAFRINKAATQLQDFLPEPIEDIFLANTLGNYEHLRPGRLFLFTKNFIITIDDLNNPNHFGLNPKEQYVHWDIIRDRYQFLKAEWASKLSISLKHSEGCDISFEAEGPNCDQLMKVFKKHIFPLWPIARAEIARAEN